MTQSLLILAFTIALLTGVAQVNVSGLVVEEGSNEPLTGASVILRNAGGSSGRQSNLEQNIID